MKTELEIVKMREGETINMYFGITLSIAKKMKACGGTFPESDITAKIIRSLLSNWNYVVCSVEESNNIDTLTVDELQSNMLVHECRMVTSNEEEQALKISHFDRADRGRGRAMTRGGRGRGRGR